MLTNVTEKRLEALPQATRERIAHIDFTLMFKGEAVRADLMERFNIAPAQVTKDFMLYRELAPQNIEYDAPRRLHVRGSQFHSLFQYDPLRTLATLSQGFGDGFSGKRDVPFPCEAPHQLNQPDLSIVATLTEVKQFKFGMFHSQVAKRYVKSSHIHLLIVAYAGMCVRMIDSIGNSEILCSPASGIRLCLLNRQFMKLS